MLNLKIRDQKMHDKLVLATVRCIFDTFNQSDWDELAYLTHGQAIIYCHPRLLRSMSFGDEDYKSCIFDVVESLIKLDDGVLDVIVDFIDLRIWLKEKAPKEYIEIFGELNATLDPLEQLAIRNNHDVIHHIRRIKAAVAVDPEQAIGSAKELVESTLKVIIVSRKEEVGTDNFPRLLRRVQKLLNIEPDSVPNAAKGADTIRRVLNSLGQVIIGIDELRNLYGTGHGRTNRSGISSRHADLVVGCAATLAIFLMETFESVDGCPK